MKICLNCKSENTDSSRFCRICGTKFPEEEEKELFFDIKEEQPEEAAFAGEEEQPEEAAFAGEEEQPEVTVLPEEEEQPGEAAFAVEEKLQTVSENYEMPKPKETDDKDRTRKKGISGFAIASLCLGCMGVFSGFLSLVFVLFSPVMAFLYLIPSILAIVFGIIGILSSGKNKKYSGRGLAVAGLVLGIVFTLFWLGLDIVLGRLVITNVERVLPVIGEILQDILG